MNKGSTKECCDQAQLETAIMELAKGDLLVSNQLLLRKHIRQHPHQARGCACLRCSFGITEKQVYEIQGHMRLIGRSLEPCLISLATRAVDINEVLYIISDKDASEFSEIIDRMIRHDDVRLGFPGLVKGYVRILRNKEAIGLSRYDTIFPENEIWARHKH